MYVHHYALQHLDVVDGEVRDQTGERFDREAYARFKYGYLPPAVEYGRGLARLIGDELFELAGADPIRIVSAPYKFLPTASHGIAQALVGELSRMAVIDRGIEAPTLVPIFKMMMSNDSYAKASEAERLRELAAQGFRVDVSLIRSAHVLIVDDIRITGSAEKATAQFLESLAPKGVWNIHAARLSEELGRANPGLENELNQSVPHGVYEVLRDIATGQFALNTRVLRHVLEYDSEADFSVFLRCAPTQILREMLDAALGSGVGYYQRYASRLQLLAKQLTNQEGIRYAAAR
jgi:hypothetical protein